MTKLIPLVQAAFSTARAKQPESSREWGRISLRVGSKLPASVLGPAIQRDGELDLLIRCMEDELAEIIAKGEEPGFAGHHLNMLSVYWVGGMYETLRLLKSREMAPDTGDFKAVFRDFELVRMPLEKHELATDWELEGKPRVFVKQPRTGTNDEYVYAFEDPTRGHIMTTGMSNRGSVRWQATDVKVDQTRWIERRDLSDRVLALW